ncbi:MAG: Asp-tRNA(Asn)/Glu-tRNA(Gln) amidotransferase subunit GatA [Clostridiaceae bacterium]|jgi:aspartyl-tRNA(Asn)/glutamyl-tRNA(Gln) amidotransferase subunit A|nr:Asp-tRNA(Asn)/Glu-tRNA(Gln) amidotransferase subunit GatA [Clostridiaceae bacterium]
MTITDMTIQELASALRKGDLSSYEITSTFLNNIERLEPSVGAYITVTKDDALSMAEEADMSFREGDDPGLLAGIPMALKDNIATSGIRTTNASRMLENFVPAYDAYVTTCLRKNGAVFLGKANMDEFSMGDSTEASAFHVTHNPYDASRVPGGSSGGSAAAVAAGEAVYALGTDTGGSICQPAAFCGLVGMRPTYGLVSRRGITAYASSFDQAGPITRTVRDNAAVLDAIAVRDPKDGMASRFAPVPDGGYVGATENAFGNPVIGYVEEFSKGLNPSVRGALEHALQFYESTGARVVSLSFPHLEEALAAYYLLTSAEGYSAINRYDGVHYGYRAADAETVDDIYMLSRSDALGLEVKCRVLLGSYLLSKEHYDAYYEKAARIRTLVIQAFNTLFNACDAILAPVTTGPAPLLGTRNSESLNGQYSSDRFTVLAPLAGLPALAFPYGLTQEGLPIGLQLMGPRFSEGRLYMLATAYEDAHERLPRPRLLHELRNGNNHECP